MLSMKRMKPKLAVGASVLLFHLAALATLCGLVVKAIPRTNSTEGDAVAHTFIIVQRPEADTVPIPEVHIHPIKIDLNTLQVIRFEDPDSLDISGIIGTSSAPQLARVQLVDSEDYASRVGLPRGHAATVLLAIEVLRDGSVGAISVIRGSGSPATDSAAIEYAHFLRWTPGTVDHQARAMRITFPVTLSRTT
jgi:TonB family protein